MEMIKMLLPVVYGRKRSALAVRAFSVLVILSVFIFNCQVARSVNVKLSVTTSFKNNATIPGQFVGSSPAIKWSGVPSGTKSFLLICHDPDAPNHHFVHWIVYDIPASQRSLTADAGSPFNRQLKQGVNSFHRLGYNGPSPPIGQLHHYIFTVYALNTKLGDLKQPKEDQLIKAMDQHVLGQGEVTGKFIR